MNGNESSGLDPIKRAVARRIERAAEEKPPELEPPFPYAMRPFPFDALGIPAHPDELPRV